MPKIKPSIENLSIAERLREIRNELFGSRGSTAMALFLGVSQPAYFQYESGLVHLPSWAIKILVEKKYVNPLYLLIGEGEKFLKRGKPILIKEGGEEYETACVLPILSDEIAAGPPRTIDDYPAEDFFAFRARWLLHPKDTFGLKVRGDSMEPDIAHGSWVLVDVKDREPRPGHIYALRAEGGCVVRKFFLNGDVWNFFPLKPSPDNKFFSFKRPATNPIIGRVVWAFRKL